MAENQNTQDLQTKLEELSQGLGISVKEFVENGYIDQSTYQIDKDAILARLDAIDVVDGTDNVETLVEKINAINEVLSNSGGELQGILSLITANTTKISNVEANLNNEISQRVSDVSDLQTQINNLQGSTDGSVSDLEAALNQEIITRASEDERVLTEAKAYSDANRIAASLIDICPAVNIFREILELEVTDCTWSRTKEHGEFIGEVSGLSMTALELINTAGSRTRWYSGGSNIVFTSEEAINLHKGATVRFENSATDATYEFGQYGEYNFENDYWNGSVRGVHKGVGYSASTVHNISNTLEGEYTSKTSDGYNSKSITTTVTVERAMSIYLKTIEIIENGEVTGTEYIYTVTTM